MEVTLSIDCQNKPLFACDTEFFELSYLLWHYLHNLQPIFYISENINIIPVLGLPCIAFQ